MFLLFIFQTTGEVQQNFILKLGTTVEASGMCFLLECLLLQCFLEGPSHCNNRKLLRDNKRPCLTLTLLNGVA